MNRHRIEIEITREAMDRARAEFPSTFPSGSPAGWTPRDLRRALDILDRSAAISDFRIVKCEVRA